MKKDKLILAGMQFFGRHGVLAEEKALGQKFIIDMEVLTDLSKAAVTDDIKDALNYADIYAIVRSITTEQNFSLIEALAEAIADRVLNNFQVQEVTVRVRKPGAPIDGVFDYMGCEVTRGLT